MHVFKSALLVYHFFQARYFKQNGQMYAARVRLCQSYFFEDLPPPADADFTLSFGGGSLAEWKKRLWYGERGDDWEAQFVKGKFLNECFALIISSCLSSSPERHRLDSFALADVCQRLGSGAGICVRVTSFFESNVTIFLQQPTELPAERNTREGQAASRSGEHFCDDSIRSKPPFVIL